jgi:MFS family permease
MRRLLLLGSTVVFLDVVFYAAITPLLPGYVHDLGLSKAAAGVLTSAYAAGTLVASLPAGFVAARIGPRRALLAGLVLLGLASFTFGFAHHVVLLDAARFVQGVAGALAWAGALTWLIMATPERRRGSVIGDVLGTAIAGSLLGPAIGALAAQIGTKPVFASVLGEAMTSPSVLRATWYVAAPSAMFGVVEVLGPLRINHLGGGAGLIAGAFMVGAALEAIMAPFVGRLSDRIGRLRPYTVGMLICAVAIALLPAAGALGLVVADLVLVSVGAGLCFAPSLAMLSDSADATGLHQGFAAGLINVAWASGQVLGGAGGGAAATAASDALPCLLAAALLLVTVAVARQMGSRAITSALRQPAD